MGRPVDALQGMNGWVEPRVLRARQAALLAPAVSAVELKPCYESRLVCRRASLHVVLARVSCGSRRRGCAGAANRPHRRQNHVVANADFALKLGLVLRT